MELTAQAEIDAAREKVFAALTDFDMIEEQAKGRGAKVKRTSAEPGAGMAWDAAFTFREKQRSAQIMLVTCDPPEKMIFHGVSGGLEVDVTLDLRTLSPARTRVDVTTVLVPKTLSARLLVQSLKLAKGGLEAGFDKRIGDAAAWLEARCQNIS